MKRLVLSLLTAAFVMAAPLAAHADEKADTKKADEASEIQDLKKRVDDLENRMKESEVVDELGHRLHPVHSLYGIRFNGGLTLIAQGVERKTNGTSRGAFTTSADLALESPVGKDGRVVGVLDFQRGAGINNLPPLVASPNGATTGINNDIESFNDDRLHVAQFYYEHRFSDRLVLSIGQLDPTMYFDANAYANTERAQFLATAFVNNPTIEFGGTENWYSPGVRATFAPFENFDVTVGALEGNGDYVDTFDSPFLMAEANFKLKPAGKEGNYRIYYWERHGRPDISFTANPADPGMARALNSGVGVSLDQALTDTTGVWLRAGVQRESVAQFNRHVSFGVDHKVACMGRAEDVVGAGYGATFIGKNYRDYMQGASPDFSPGAEHYLELYYNISVAGAAQDKGFHISPDVQYIVNPGGDKNADKLFVYGIRLQAFF